MSSIENPIILRKIRIKNIGVFEDFTFDFTHPIQIFYGITGAGKTTLLNLIHHIRYSLPLDHSDDISNQISKDSLMQCCFSPDFFQFGFDVEEILITISYDDFISEPYIKEENLRNLFLRFSIENFESFGSSIDLYTIDYYEFDKKLSVGQNWFNYLKSFLEKQFSYKIILLDDVLAFLDDEHANIIINSLKKISNSNQIIFANSRVPISLLESQDDIAISGLPNDQVWFNERLRQIIHKETSIYNEFKNSIQVIKNLMKIKPEDPDQRQKLLYLFHINIITTMETFFTDALKKAVNNDKIILKRLLSESEDFNKKKYKL
ncbi:MAG: AAA family ATPase, partial [Candidatus Thorarchaeota archaeon]